MGATIGSILVILGVLGALAGIAYAKYLQIQSAMAEPPPPEPIISVKLAPVEPLAYRRSSVVVGTVLAPQSVRLRTELTGVVTEVRMKPGQVVEKDERLIQFDTRIEEAELKSAIAAEELAKSTIDRMDKLSRSNASSQQEADLAKADLTRAKADVERLGVLIEKKSLRAPFAARVGLFNIHVGQYLDAGAEIAMLEGIADHLLIDFAMPPHIARTMAIGDEIRAQSNPDDSFVTAKIIAIDAQADVVSRSITARAKLENPPPTLKPNDSIRIIVDYGDPVTVLAVPGTAVRRDPSGTLVYVVVEKENQLRAEPREVILAGSGTGSVAMVASGLQVGERVVAEGSFKVYPGVLLMDMAEANSEGEEGKNGEEGNAGNGSEEGPR